MANAAQTLSNIRAAAATELTAAQEALTAGDIAAALERADRAVHVLRGLAGVEGDVQRIADDWSKLEPAPGVRSEL